MTDLLLREKNVAYQINPRRESTAINITNFSGLSPLNGPGVTIWLMEVNITRLNPSEPLVTVPPEYRTIYIDGVLQTPTPSSRKRVTNNVSVMFNSSFFGATGMTTTASRVFVNFTFGLYDPGGTVPTPGRCINSTSGNPPFSYVYGSPYVTQPRLIPAVVEVSVW